MSYIRGLFPIYDLDCQLIQKQNKKGPVVLAHLQSSAGIDICLPFLKGPLAFVLFLLVNQHLLRGGGQL